jgi:hypothetical protein
MPSPLKSPVKHCPTTGVTNHSSSGIGPPSQSDSFHEVPVESATYHRPPFPVQQATSVFLSPLKSPVKHCPVTGIAAPQGPPTSFQTLRFHPVPVDRPVFQRGVVQIEPPQVANDAGHVTSALPSALKLPTKHCPPTGVTNHSCGGVGPPSQSVIRP